MKWSSKSHGKTLCGMFENAEADPLWEDAGHINWVKDSFEVFELLDKRRFRENFKKTATNCMSTKAMRGFRKKLGDFQALRIYFSCSEGKWGFSRKC